MLENSSLPCPGCHTPLPPEATGCQICMRTRTKQEIMRGYAKLRDDKARKQRRPFQILAVVLILGGLGKLILTYHDKITATASFVKNKLVLWSDNMRDPKNYSAKPQDAPPPPAAAPAAPVAPDDTLRNQPIPAPAPPTTSPPPPQSMAKPSSPRPLSKNSWRVSGTAYYLHTLTPAPGATVTFEFEGTTPVRTITDENGAYVIDVVKREGWTVSLDAPNMRKGQILDLDPPYRVRDSDERRAAF